MSLLILNKDYYVVTLLLRLGEYEKHTRQLLEAESEDDACYLALCGETHNAPLTKEQYDNDDEWWDDCSIYEIDGVKVVAPDQVDVLKQYLWW